MDNLQLSLFDSYEHPFVSKVFDVFPNNESEEVEYKLAEGGFPDEFWKTYSAFANSNGGIIVLGVKEKKNEFIFEGIPTKKIGTYKKVFWDSINNPNKVSINLMSDADVADVIFEEKHFLTFKVPAASRVQRPVHITSNPFDNTYKRMFLMIGSAEKAGSGVSKIMSGWGYAHWRSPFLTIEYQPDRLILELPMFSILPETTLLELKNLFGDRIDALTTEELTILATCQIEGEVSNSRLQYMIDKHRTDITKILQDLCKSKFLLSENKSRWTTYHLNTNFALDESNANVANLDTSAVNLDTSEINVIATDNEGGTSDTLTPNLDTLTPNLDTSKKQSKRLSKTELEDRIIETCKSEFITTEQIAIAVDRSPSYIQNEILPTLVSNGKLVMLYPKRNNPNQAYKAVSN